MLVLGITDGITCGAAIARDGVVLAAVNEERISRLKMAYGFPRQSISEVMRLAGVGPDDIDLVVAATVNNYFFDGVRPFNGWLASDKGIIRNAVFSTVGRFGSIVDRIPLLEELYYRARWPIFAARRRAIGRVMRDEFGVKAPLEFANHHLAHATSTYFTSGFEEAIVVTMDGGGDGASSHIYDVKDGRFKQIGYTSAYNSLANYYAYVTHVCGFKAQKHEGKITGLAAHGEPRFEDLLNSMITMHNGELRNVGGKVFQGAISDLQNKLPKGWTREDLASSIQLHAERKAKEYVSRFLDPENPKDVAVAGGLFANVRINQEIYELPGVRNFFVHPGMTDCGLAVGAALIPCMQDRDGPKMPWDRSQVRDVYYGADYTEKEIEQEIRNSGMNFTRPPSIEGAVAERLAQGYVVARFNGRMEYGPRALGNRSILYQPADRAVNDWLNENLQRTEFMPFAPSTLIEHASQHYKDYQGAEGTARFMTITFDCTDWMKKTCPGVVHIDGTARPQLVAEQDNPSYYGIIDEFRKLTGVPTIINTSFNMHEEPIVCSPGDAIRAFRLGHLDWLAINDFLVESPEPITHELRSMEKVTAGK